MAGTLYIVATPIGNLEDITLRALGVLKAVDLIACEDTRHTRKLLARYDISKPTISYHEHNERERARELALKLEAGINIALVSDAGTPLLSDPGFRIVTEAIEREINIVPLPGPSALMAALAASGLATTAFTFAGFLPPRPVARKARLAELSSIKSTLIFYEAPHRIKEAIVDALSTLGDRPSVVARELTKVHEEFLRGTLSELSDRLAESDVKGEIVLLIGPPTTGQTARPGRSILEEIEQLMREEGLDQKSALKRIARLRGISKSEAYRLAVAERAAAERLL